MALAIDIEAAFMEYLDMFTTWASPAGRCDGSAPSNSRRRSHRTP